MVGNASAWNNDMNFEIFGEYNDKNNDNFIVEFPFKEFFPIKKIHYYKHWVILT